MTPKQKAKELIQEHWFRIDEYIQPKTWLEKDLLIKLTEKAAKDCALLTVDELLEATKRYDYTLGPNPSYNDYWLKVKYQIENL
jgi:hypothetical protein